MIDRTILKQIELSVKTRPVTLITGARQVGKSTLAQLFMKKGFSYVSLDSSRERELAIKDPELFLDTHPWPLIIDEIQYAPGLFDALECVVNKEKMKRNDNYGMYIITGSQMYQLMRGVTQSMAGRISIIHMPPLSRNEIIKREEPVFSFDILKISDRSKMSPLTVDELFQDIVHGYYPELYSNPLLTPEKFYSDYLETYLERDVSEILKLKDKMTFMHFMELLASLTGEELVVDNISKVLGVDNKTVKSWLSVLLAGDIIYLLEPYSEISITKRIVKRPKIYFSDTGLACYLARVNSPKMLQASFLSARFVETYIINELRKTYLNNGGDVNFYYYRDSNQKEINLLILDDGKIHCVECKSGISYSKKAVSSFDAIKQTRYQLGTGLIICNTNTIYPIEKGVYAVPIAGI